MTYCVRALSFARFSKVASAVSLPSLRDKVSWPDFEEIAQTPSLIGVAPCRWALQSIAMVSLEEHEPLAPVGPTGLLATIYR